MKPRRPLLVLLLSLLIPLSGLAGMETDMGDCPLDGLSMDMADAAMVLQMQAMGHDHPCCNDADTISRTGQLCKPGQECGTGFSLPAMHAGAGDYAMVNDVFLAITAPLLSGPPDELLRPPASFLTIG